jgi:hypothetical protein
MISRRKDRRRFFTIYRISVSVVLLCAGFYFLNLIRIHEKQVAVVLSSTGSISQVIGNQAVVFPSPRKKSRCTLARTAEDLKKRCYKEKAFNDLGPSCERIETWGDVNRCLVRRSTPEVLDHYEISIIGERNSGTKFIMRELQQCFPRKKFNVRTHRDFIRAKHFFQPVRESRDYNFQDTILIAVFRDPVEWIAAMIEKPYHSPNHVTGFDNVTDAVIPLPWQDFVSRRWKMPRSNFDMDLITSGRVQETYSRLICKQQFTFPEVVPCRYDNTSTLVPSERLRGYEPVYELRRDGTGRSFEHILELRSEKIFNFLVELPLLVKLGGFSAVRYEDLLKDGTQSFLEQIGRIMGVDELPASCKPTSPQPERLGARDVPDGLKEWVNQHADVERERLLGYRD